MVLRGKSLLALMLCLLVGLVGGCGGGGGGQGGGRGGDENTITIGYIDWDEDVAVTNLAAILLEEELGYEVETTLSEVGHLYSGVATGDIDAFLDVWLPNTHASYWEEYQDDVVDLGQWYEGTATLGIGVPDYVEENAIPGYGLDYNLVASSTPAMISELEDALDSNQPIAFTAWKPHWMFTAFDIRYLEDPEGEMGGPEQISAIAREGLEEDAPEAFQFLDNTNLTEEQLGELELAINEAGDPEVGARAWLEENREVVESWLPS